MEHTSFADIQQGLNFRTIELRHTRVDPCKHLRALMNCLGEEFLHVTLRLCQHRPISAPVQYKKVDILFAQQIKK